MEKKICDLIGKDITNGPRYSVMLYNETADKAVLHYDLSLAAARKVE